MPLTRTRSGAPAALMTPPRRSTRSSSVFRTGADVASPSMSVVSEHSSFLEEEHDDRGHSVVDAQDLPIAALSRMAFALAGVIMAALLKARSYLRTVSPLKPLKTSDLIFAAVVLGLCLLLGLALLMDGEDGGKSNPVGSVLGGISAAISLPFTTFLLFLDTVRHALLSVPNVLAGKSRPARHATLQTSSSSSSSVDYDLIVEQLIQSGEFKTLVQTATRDHIQKFEKDLTAFSEAQMDELRKTVEAFKADRRELHSQAMLDLEEKMKTLRLKIEEQSRAQITEASRQVGLKLEEDIADLRLGLNKQSTYLKDLELELAGRGSGETGSEEASAQLSALTARLKALEEAQTSLQLDLGKCCRNEAQLQTSVQEFMRQWVETSLTTNSSDEDPSARAFKAWLENHYMSKDQFQERIQILVETMREDIREEILAAVTEEAQRKARESAEEAVSKYTSDQKFQDQISSQISVVASSAAAAAAAATVSASSAASETEIVKIVQSALQKYDADKTGMFDFALESAGGTIASTRCTETHDVSNALYSVLGIPIWWEKNDPRTILQPGSSPGQCWAFKGSHGSVVVKLSSPIHVSAVSLEHISKMISRDGTIDSAPKSFSVLGLQRIDDPRPMHLGNFTYSDSDQPVQTFYLQQLTDRPALDLIELKILSNQGHNAYTCLYRFRVHGRLPDEKRTKVTASENEPTV